MTLIITAKGKDSLVIGADSRAVVTDHAGTRFINDNAEKMIQLNKYCCVLMAGDSEVGVFLIEKFKKNVKEKEDVISINEKLRKFCREEFRPYIDFVHPLSRDYPQVSFILSGLEKINRIPKKPRIFILKSWNYFFPGEEKDYMIFGKDVISRYLFTKFYKKNKHSVEELTKLIVQCLYDTEKIDGEAGGDMHMATINKYGFSETATEEYIEEIKQRDLIRLMDEE